jgi:hypothetical protein
MNSNDMVKNDFIFGLESKDFKKNYVQSHKLALLNLFNRGRQPASWKWCPPHQAGLDLCAHLAYPVEFTYHPLPMIPFPRLNPIYPSLETLLLPPLVLSQCKVV